MLLMGILSIYVIADHVDRERSTQSPRRPLIPDKKKPLGILGHMVAKANTEHSVNLDFR